MLSINMIRTTTLSVIAITLAVTVSSNRITSPDVCLSDLECPSTSFCERDLFEQLPLCVPRLPKHAVCTNVGLSQCRDGLTCTFDDSINSNNPTCQPRSPRGATCRLDATRPCADSLICERNTTTCQPFTDGFVGTPCQSDSDCQQDKGFYCQTQPGVCAPKRGPGGECNRRADNFECLGFCASRILGEGICFSARKEGQSCTDSDQCENLIFERSEPRSDPLVCNNPKGVVGRCVRQSSLINRLGAKCNPDLDRCDVRRSLSCRPTRGGIHVCQQRSSRFDPFQTFCEPKSRFSRCPWRDVQTECRVERIVQGQFVPFGPSPFFQCRQRSEKVARGGVCVTEYASCAHGTECREVPGVEPEPTAQFQRFSPPRVAFCVRIAQEGESCGDVNDKFTTQCDEGLRCKNRRCVKTDGNEPPFDSTVTHAGLNALCADLPCVPGLVCDNDEFRPGKRCLLPLRTVGKGQTCTDRAVERRRCEKGLVCALRKDGTNVRRCREPREAGDYCQDDDCPEGLVCPAAFVLTGNREQEERRCYDPNTTLELGETCDPEASPSQPRCVVNVRPDENFPGDTVSEPMRCLRKGNRFICRTVAGLFNFCDEAKDITCDSDMKCGDLGICIPVDE